MLEPLTQEQKNIYRRYLLGLGLILTGVALLVVGLLRGASSPSPPPSAQPAKAEGSGQTQPPRAGTPLAATFNLRYSANRWRVEALNGREQWSLPEFLPPDSLMSPPRSPLPAARIAELFVGIMKRNRFALSQTEFQSLVDIDLNGEPLFADREALAALVAGGLTPPPEPEPAQKETPNPVLAQQRQDPITDRLPPTIPVALDPTNPAFMEAGRAFRERIREDLTRATGTRRGHVLSFPKDFGGETELRISGNARTRLLAADFGEEKRDKAIYLQILLVKDGHPMLVDGIPGPGTKGAFAKWLTTRFSDTTLRDRYRQLVTTHIF